MNRAAILWTMAMALCWPCWAAAQESEIKWKLAGGDVLTYEHTIDQQFKLTNDGSTFEYEQRIEANERLEVDRTTIEGNYQVRVTVTRVKVLVDGKVVFDSDAPEKGDPEAVGLFKQAIGEPQAFIMTPSGRLADKQGATLQERAQQSFSGAAMGGGESLPMAILALPLPETALAAGKTWNIEAEEENENGTKMLCASVYRFDGPATGGHAVSGQTTLRLEKAPPEMKLRDGSGHQRAVFDDKGGMLRESSLDFRVALENVVEGKLVQVVNALKSTTKLKDRAAKKR
ncbi:MAG: hypothetical protein HYY16_01660 [Planctomycetes bacterium]|nr:hypothetical protein [Planctomycetota bacterium]